ncbi:Inhibitory POU protein like [Argiope bruennichi]|uniref:Inhibitory POU protein like n=1 Tax=Argiope bruennichi TaxID=94029 RepID=A0A8T0EKR8_ARGBR|nr:Inhibitory POU protein like [Argiope bruennichi]
MHIELPIFENVSYIPRPVTRLNTSAVDEEYGIKGPERRKGGGELFNGGGIPPLLFEHVSLRAQTDALHSPLLFLAMLRYDVTKSRYRPDPDDRPPHHPPVGGVKNSRLSIATVSTIITTLIRGGLPTHTFERIQNDDVDPRDLEAFAERFKQRRIKLGVTQADVGRALVHLKLPGVGTLSQSTICRFESLTLSRNNMLALKPVLQSWLEAAECQARGKKRDTPFVLPPADRKRKRTSIAALEKRSLEAYFAVQQRPSGDKIASIAKNWTLKRVSSECGSAIRDRNKKG